MSRIDYTLMITEALDKARGELEEDEYGGLLDYITGVIEEEKEVIWNNK